MLKALVPPKHNVGGLHPKYGKGRPAPALTELPKQHGSAKTSPTHYLYFCNPNRTVLLSYNWRYTKLNFNLKLEVQSEIFQSYYKIRVR